MNNSAISIDIKLIYINKMKTTFIIRDGILQSRKLLSGMYFFS